MYKQEKKHNLEKILSNKVENLSTGNVYPELLELDETQKIKNVNSWATKKELDEDELYEGFEQEYLIQRNPYTTCFPL